MIKILNPMIKIIMGPKEGLKFKMMTFQNHHKNHLNILPSNLPIFLSLNSQTKINLKKANITIEYSYIINQFYCEILFIF